MYKCNNCDHTEQRSIPYWHIECRVCETGILTATPAGDFVICQVCGEIHNPMTRQCPNDGNTMLTFFYADEPKVNSDIIKEINHCRATGTTQHFECTVCQRSYDIFRSTASHIFCNCGELLSIEVDLKTFRLSKKLSQRMMAMELDISLRCYTDIELGKRQPTPLTRRRIGNLMSH